MGYSDKLSLLLEMILSKLFNLGSDLNERNYKRSLEIVSTYSRLCIFDFGPIYS